MRGNSQAKYTHRLAIGTRVLPSVSREVSRLLAIQLTHVPARFSFLNAQFCTELGRARIQRNQPTRSASCHVILCRFSKLDPRNFDTPSTRILTFAIASLFRLLYAAAFLTVWNTTGEMYAAYAGGGPPHYAPPPTYLQPQPPPPTLSHHVQVPQVPMGQDPIPVAHYSKKRR